MARFQECGREKRRGKKTPWQCWNRRVDSTRWHCWQTKCTLSFHQCNFWPLCSGPAACQTERMSSWGGVGRGQEDKLCVQWLHSIRILKRQGHGWRFVQGDVCVNLCGQFYTYMKMLDKRRKVKTTWPPPCKRSAPHFESSVWQSTIWSSQYKTVFSRISTTKRISFKQVFLLFQGFVQNTPPWNKDNVTVNLITSQNKMY